MIIAMTDSGLRAILNWILWLSLALAVGCGREDRALPPGPEEPGRNLAQYDAFLERIEREHLEAAWIRATAPGTAAKPRPFGVIPILLITDDEVAALREQLKDPEQVRLLAAIHDRAVQAQSAADPDVARIAALAQAIHSRIAPREIQLRHLVAETDPEARRVAWMSARKEALELEPLLRDLAKARNAWARRRNGQGCLQLLQQHRGVETSTAERLKDQLRLALRLPTESLRIHPWDAEAHDPELMHRFAIHLDADGCVRRGRSFLQWAGLPGSPPGFTAAVVSGNDFSASATYMIRPPVDVRITMLPGAGIAAQWSVLHEFGHAAQALLATERGPLALRRTRSSAVSEACAKIAERLAYTPEWLRRQEVPEADIQALKAWEVESERRRMLDILADLEFESAYYNNPDSNLTAEYRRVQHELAGVQQPDFPAWALQRHLAFRPLERWDYMLARCAQAAIYRRLQELPGGLFGTAASAALRTDVLAYAAGRTYEEWFFKAAGTAPNCSAWIEDVAGLK